MLPESLQRNLKRFEKRLFIIESTVFICGGLLGILLSFVILFISDRFWDTPVLLRFIMTAGGCLVFGSAAVWWSRVWLVRRRDDRALARLVQTGMGGIGDRLLGAVELAEGRNVPEHISPALCKAAIEQVASQMETYDFRKAVKSRKSRYLFSGMLLCGVVVAAIAVFVPSAFWNSLVRWGKPASTVPRYTFVSIEQLPVRMVVPHGEPFKINIRLSKASLWRPESASCRFDDQAEINAVIRDGAAEFDLAGRVAEGDLFIRIGDVKRSVRVLPVFRPELVELKAFIKLPEYLGYPDIDKKVEAGTCEVLEGSQICLSGIVSRELQEAELQADGRSSKLTTESNVFRTDFQDSFSVSNCVFMWRDVYGLEPRSPYAVRVLEVQDMVPSAECRGISRSVAILEDEVLNIEAYAEDDYGLKDLRLRWSVKGPDNQSEIEEELISEGGRQIKALDGKYILSPLANNIPEESVITLYAAATDYRPGAGAELSVPHRIYVLSKATHAKLVQELMERVQNRIEDLLHDEQALIKGNEEILAMDKESMLSSEGSEETRKNEYREREQARKLEDIVREMKDLMKETMRNSDIDAKAAKEWAEMMEKLGELSQQEMKDAVSSMSKAASGESEKRAENLEKSVQIEKDIVEKLKESAGDMSKTIEDMFARNFVNRLRQLSEMQAEVGVTAKAILPKSIGLSREDLPAAVEKLIAGQEERQSRITGEAGYIYDDLGGYYNRTRRAVFDVIRKDMASKKMTESLDELKSRITVNLGVSVIDGSAVWSVRFKEWADMLAEDSGKKDGGGEGEPEELSEQDLEVIIELIRLRHGEESLREQTRMLEERKAGNMNYGMDARKLAKKQNELDDSVLKLQRKVRNKKIKMLLEKIDGEMLNTEVYLKRPQTDSETVAIQTEIIELLSGAMSECSGGKQSGLSMMLMQMMGMGKSGGGSNAGGTTEMGNLSFEESESSQAFESGTLDTTGGVDEQWPEEFREMIEAYHNALEKQ